MYLAINDLLKSLRHLPLICHMAYSDTKARYKRSMLGPLWLTLGAAVGVVGLGLVWSQLLHQERSELIPSLTVGLLLWQFISGCVTESTSTFVRQSQIIRNLQLPFFIHPIQLIVRQSITLAHNLIVLVVVLIIYPQNLGLVSLFSIVGFLIVLINLLWISVMLSMIGARFRDVEQIVQALMPIIFFLTPVLYKAGHAGVNQAIIWLNPFTYFITLVRDPLFGSIPSIFVYQITLGMAIIGWSLTLIVFNRFAPRIAFWI
ncbi:ABC transporter permease [Yersinia aleksiciae]|uniref:ABC-2 n=1 Tax=Yersinia aleksiciae TaxID=263819 RepID=A0A0T9TD53_YERAE|nr:ABC transporter permease [Yersinia aleksiciae]MDA5498482.1 ABC transporter permease [Yersinia aleksiciae]NIK98835.1 ABC transporter permease [Yersinia aleksiciae]WQC72018.1 ABC transporter permease [Yersinia aleksiciae]CNK75340.1 ABC-2 [Yersinia aleksiciae]